MTVPTAPHDGPVWAVGAGAGGVEQAPAELDPRPHAGGGDGTDDDLHGDDPTQGAGASGPGAAHGDLAVDLAPAAVAGRADDDGEPEAARRAEAGRVVLPPAPGAHRRRAPAPVAVGRPGSGGGHG